MATGIQVGRVAQLVGQAKAAARSGGERMLRVGDPVFAGEEITTAEQGGVSILLVNGERLELVDGEQIVLDVALVGLDDGSMSDVAAAQQAILAGADPGAILGAPAAGGTGGTGDPSSAASPPPIVAREGREVTPESGFPTAGLAPQTQPEPPEAEGVLGDGAEQPLPANVPPDARDDLVLSNIVDGATLRIPAAVLLANDSDEDGDPLTLVSAQNPIGGTLSFTSDAVLFTPQPEFAAIAGQRTESEGAFGNDAAASAEAIARNEFGKPIGADVAAVKYQDGSLDSLRFQGSIVDLESADGVTRDEDWLRLELRAGERLILDIDQGDDGDRDVGIDDNDVDTFLELYDASGALRLAQNDDSVPSVGGTGSVQSEFHANSLDAYLEYQVAETGSYYVRVSAWDNSPFNLFSDSGDYDLWISIENPQSGERSFQYTIDDGISGQDSATVSVQPGDSATSQSDSGNAVLIGSTGENLLSGGAGSDLFLSSAATAGTDSGIDYRVAAGDAIDPREVLEHSATDVSGLAGSVALIDSGSLSIEQTGVGDDSSREIAQLDAASVAHDVAGDTGGLGPDAVFGTGVTLLIDSAGGSDSVV